MPPSSKIVAKGPETIMREYRTKVNELTIKNDFISGLSNDINTFAQADWLKSALASVVMWANQQKGFKIEPQPHTKWGETEFDNPAVVHGWNLAMDEKEASLNELAEQIAK